MIHFAPPPPTAPPATVLSIDWAAGSRAFPLYRAPWDPCTTPGESLPKALSSLRPLPQAPIRVGSLRRTYWIGPVSDFVFFLGYAALGGNLADSEIGRWTHEPGLEPHAGLAATILPTALHPLVRPWEFPPIQVWVRDSP